MKKFIIIGMALAILCTGFMFGVSEAKHDKIEAAAEEIVSYVEETYGENCMFRAYDIDELNVEELNSVQQLFDEDIRDCTSVIAIYDEFDNCLGAFAVRI